MNDNSAHTYKKAKDKLLEFIKLSEIKTIIFHQFEFLIMYFPVYMIICDLKGDLDKLGIHLSFKPKENDKAIIKDIAEESFESFELDNEKNTLHIGLCEPVIFNDIKHAREITIPGYEHLDNNELKNELRNECLQKKSKNDSEDKVSYFLHLPFINFPPIYGVSLINNESIKDIKLEKEQEKAQKGEVCLSITDYWKYFSAKLCLLDKVDFRSLVASSYPDGSTTDWFIRKEIGFPLKEEPKCITHLNKEFDALFDKEVDVAFTVQPWAAISNSVYRKSPYGIDIVYKDVCKRFDCTSLILKTNKDEYLFLGDYILNCLKILLEKKIADLYRMDSHGLGDSIEYYCKLLHNHNHQNISLDECFKFESKMALRLNIDSQIYREQQETERMTEVVDQKKVFYDYFATKYGGSTVGIDLFEKLMFVTLTD